MLKVFFKCKFIFWEDCKTEIKLECVGTRPYSIYTYGVAKRYENTQTWVQLQGHNRTGQFGHQIHMVFNQEAIRSIADNPTLLFEMTVLPPRFLEEFTHKICLSNKKCMLDERLLMNNDLMSDATFLILIVFIFVILYLFYNFLRLYILIYLFL